RSRACSLDRVLGHGRQLLQADTVHERREGLARGPTLLEELRQSRDGRRRVLLAEPTEPLADAPPPLADGAADQDRAVRPLGPVALGHRVAGEADVADVVLAARVRAATDLDPETTEARREAVPRGGIVDEVGADAFGDPHRARDRQRAVVHARARDDV